MQKEAKARIKINELLLKAGWRFFDDDINQADDDFGGGEDDRGEV